MKRSFFKRKSISEQKPMKRTKLSKKSKHPTKKLAARLEKLSHNHVRQRDGVNGEIKGYCFDCGVYAEGQQFQCGHWEADSTGGALLRYHPHNMHGQAGGCNMKHRQEHVKINYTMRMLEKYGIDRVNELRALRKKSIKADSIFYETMIKLYEEGDEEKIINYLESL